MDVVTLRLNGRLRDKSVEIIGSRGGLIGSSN